MKYRIPSNNHELAKLFKTIEFAEARYEYFTRVSELVRGRGERDIEQFVSFETEIAGLAWRFGMKKLLKALGIPISTETESGLDLAADETDGLRLVEVSHEVEVLPSVRDFVIVDPETGEERPPAREQDVFRAATLERERHENH